MQVVGETACRNPSLAFHGFTSQWDSIEPFRRRNIVNADGILDLALFESISYSVLMDRATTLTEDDWQSYGNFVIERANDLVRNKVWHGITSENLTRWISQFERLNARPLAAILLDALVYRSPEQFKSSLRFLFAHLPWENDKGGPELVSAFRARKDPMSRLVPVLGLGNPPTKSGPYVLRIAERDLNLNSRWFAWGQTLVEHAHKLESVLFIDDFCGTGQQFTKFLKGTVNIDRLHNENPNLRLVYLTGALHERGEGHLKDAFPFIELFPAERLGNELDLFESTFPSCPDLPDKQQRIKAEYARVTADLGFPDVHEYNLNLCFGFEHASPNNSLPVFWCENEHWQPLLRR